MNIFVGMYISNIIDKWTRDVKVPAKRTERAKRDRKTKIQILQTIKEFLNEAEGKPFHKSDLREKGVDPRTAEEFFRIIQYCQNDIPRIRITEVGASLIIQESTATDILEEFRESMSVFDPKQAQLEEAKTIQESLSEIQAGLRAPPLQEKMEIPWSSADTQMNLHCEICNSSVDYPLHCGLAMKFDMKGKRFTCANCGATVKIPVHCGKKMSIEYSDGKRVLACVEIS